LRNSASLRPETSLQSCARNGPSRRSTSCVPESSEAHAYDAAILVRAHALEQVGADRPLRRCATPQAKASLPPTERVPSNGDTLCSMNSVEFRGEPGDLERFAHHVLKRGVAVDELNPSEHRMCWDAQGQSGFSSSTRLRSGVRLSATRLRWDSPWAFQFQEEATPLKFLLSRGATPRMTPSNGPSHTLSEGVLQIKRATQPVSTTCEFLKGGSECEHLALEIAPEKLLELLGAQALPRPLRELLNHTTSQATYEQPVPSAVFRLLEELLFADGRAASRQLFLEARGLELLAVLVDELELVGQALSPLGQRDVERLERARRVLLERIDAPPSLPELARHVGLNEVKLKLGFRTLFGTTTFAYLRAQRMELARRLLLQRNLNVTEVAVRVGYANPSKFAAAFRKHFGFPPSTLR
jgi:AraC-like DNA-binding protein